MKRLDFDEESHVYSVDGVKLPNVTSIIKGVFGSRSWWTDRSAEKGRALHLACHYEILGRLDSSTLDPAIQGRFSAFLDFREKTSYEYVGTEERYYSPKYWFAGTVDIETQTGIMDIKSSLDPAAYLQLGAYTILRPSREAQIIELKENGSWKLHSLKTKSTWKASLRYWQTAFLNVLSVYNLMIRHKL